MSSDRYDSALYSVGWSGCQSDGLLIAGVVWSKVTVLPASICLLRRDGGDHLAVLVDDVGLQRGVDGGGAVMFCTSVLISTVLDEPELVASVGVVTHVPYQAT